MVFARHKEAQRDKAEWEYEDAVYLYGVYAERFGGAGDPEVTFFHGEALYSLKRWPEARAAYRQYVASAPGGAHVVDAAEALIHTHLQEIGLDQYGRRQEDLAQYALAETDATDWRPSMLAVFDEYLRLDTSTSEVHQTVEHHRGLVSDALAAPP